MNHVQRVGEGNLRDGKRKIDVMEQESKGKKTRC